MKDFNNTWFMMIVKGIIVFLHIVFIFLILIPSQLLWYRITNKKKYYEMKKEIQDF